jgi:hypothetical protein
LVLATKPSARGVAIVPRTAGESATYSLDLLGLGDDGFVPPDSVDGPDGMFQLSIDEDAGTFTVTTLHLFDGNLNATTPPVNDIAKRQLPIAEDQCQGQASSVGGAKTYGRTLRGIGICSNICNCNP